MERQLPKNVRQIGNVCDSSKIYVEDYVDTFFNQLCSKAEQEMIGAFLVGETIREEEQDYIFIYGAIQMTELETKGKDIIVNENVWKHACETCKEYFENAEILGWFITGGEQPIEVNHNITKMHQKYFSREQSIFVTKDARDKEEKFYIYKYRNMMECSGHYVYYEKNLEMQNYMISTRKRTGLTPGELIEDRVTKNFRSIIREKTEKNEQKTQSRLVYAMSTFLVLVILVIGATLINNYDRMKGVKDTLEQSAKKGSEDETVEVLGDIVHSEQETQEEDKQDDETQDTENEDDEQQGAGEDEETKNEETSETDNQDETTDHEETVNKEETPEQTTVSEIYIVKKGDTLQSISRKTYGDISYVDDICQLNGLEDGNLIYIGQKLLLP